MTSPKLATEFAALAEKATQGDVIVTECCDYWVQTRGPGDGIDGDLIAHCGDIGWPDFQEKQREWQANAAFIAWCFNHRTEITAALRASAPTIAGEDEREAFEKWWRSSDLFEDCDGIRMALASPFETAWEAWQAARSLSPQSVRLTDKERVQLSLLCDIAHEAFHILDDSDGDALREAAMPMRVDKLDAAFTALTGSEDGDPHDIIREIRDRLTAQPEPSKEE